MEDDAALWVEADGEQHGEAFFLPLPEECGVLADCDGVEVDEGVD